MTRPPSSRPFAPFWPFADHKLQFWPAIVPLATSVAWAVRVAAGVPDAAALVTGKQSEFGALFGLLRPVRPGKLAGNCPGDSCQMPWLALIGTRSPLVQRPKPRLCSADTSPE